MANATATKTPSEGVCDRISVVTEEGLELEARLLAFVREAGEALDSFGAEVAACGLDAHGLDRVVVASGLGVLHALVERMSAALDGLLGDTEAVAA